MIEELKLFLSSADGQHIQRVYLNDKMEWLFAPRPGFETMVTRAEVLAIHPPKTANLAGQKKIPART